VEAWLILACHCCVEVVVLAAAVAWLLLSMLLRLLIISITVQHCAQVGVECQTLAQNSLLQMPLL
jgi:hypothetical protein